ncbi:MAG: hypothetical protein LJE73_00155, partial [Proteobacteria bacterium]|nr:hypothetical protein [Pseudomonadota bacterium]
MATDTRDMDSKTDDVLESVEVDVLPEAVAEIEEIDELEEQDELEDQDDEVEIEIEEVVEEKTVRYEAGAIPDGQLDATRLYLSEIGFSPLLT